MIAAASDQVSAAKNFQPFSASIGQKDNSQQQMPPAAAAAELAAQQSAQVNTALQGMLRQLRLARSRFGLLGVLS